MVRYYLKGPESYGTRKRPGRPRKMANAARRRLFQEASKRQSSLRDQQKSHNLPIIPRSVRQLLYESPNRVYRNRKTAPTLTTEHKKMRVNWVKKKVTCTMEKWEKRGVF